MGKDIEEIEILKEPKEKTLKKGNKQEWKKNDFGKCRDIVEE